MSDLNETLIAIASLNSAKSKAAWDKEFNLDNQPPLGANYIDNGPSNIKYLRINESLHDYWCAVDMRWVTFEGGHNPIQKHWAAFEDELTKLKAKKS